MSNQPNPESAAVRPGGALEIHPRIWPAVFISIAHLTATYAFSLFASTNVQSAVGLGVVPLAAALLLLIWWLAASRVPGLDRLAGLVLFIAALVAVIFSQKSRGLGYMLLAFALPAMTYGLVAMLVLTYSMRWPARRWVLVVFMVACAAVCCAKRVDSIGGNLAPVVSWRWNPTTDERSKALTVSEVHGTAVVPDKAGPSDWPAFRGADRDNRVVGTRFSTDWTTPPRELWRIKIGPAWSSFIAVGDYLFTQEQRGADELVTCYRAATGELVWQNRAEARFEDSMGLGPRATPTFADGRLYTQGGTGVLQCLDASTGNAIWKRDLAKDTETGVPGYGFSSSPLIVGELLIEFSCGGEGKSVIAYNRATGDIAWRAGHAGKGYSSPHLAVLGGVRQVLIINIFGIQALTPETGATLWEHSWPFKEYPRCIQPLLLDGNAVMIGTTGAPGSRLIRVEQKDSAWTVAEEWTTKKFRPYFNDAVSHKGFAYGFDGERLACIDLKTGQRRWEGKLYGGQVLLIVDIDMLLVLSENGDVVLVPATPERFSETARFKALAGKTWNHPVVANGKLYVRNSEEAACFELPAK